MSVLEVARSLGALHDARLALYYLSRRVHRQAQEQLTGREIRHAVQHTSASWSSFVASYLQLRLRLCCKK